MGDHTETIQIDYDPEVITYAEILDLFWAWHNPTASQWSRQYMSIAFYHDEAQKKEVSESISRLEQQLNGTVNTEVMAFSKFYLAEDYHQKYYLQNEQELAYEILAYYHEFDDFVNSTAAARLNGIIGGYVDPDLLEEELATYGLSSTGLEILQRYTR